MKSPVVVSLLLPRLARLLGEIVLTEGQLLEARITRCRRGQLAAGGTHQLGEHGAADLVPHEMDGAVAHAGIETVRMTTIDVRKRALERQARTVADVFVRP